MRSVSSHHLLAVKLVSTSSCQLIWAECCRHIKAEQGGPGGWRVCGKWRWWERQQGRSLSSQGERGREEEFVSCEFSGAQAQPVIKFQPSALESHQHSHNTAVCTCVCRRLAEVLVVRTGTATATHDPFGSCRTAAQDSEGIEI